MHASRSVSAPCRSMSRWRSRQNWNWCESWRSLRDPIQRSGCPNGSCCASQSMSLYDTTRTSRIPGRIIHKALERVSPLAVPVLLEIGRETVSGEAADELLAEAAGVLLRE